MTRRTGLTAGKSSDSKIWLPEPLPHQLPILKSSARCKVICAGRRWGKTVAGLCCVVAGHGPSEKPLKGAINGGTIWWVAPTYGIASHIWRDLKKSLWQFWDNKSEIEKRIVLPNGGSVSVKSSDNPDSLRGVGLDGVVFDEASYIRQDAWAEAIRPALSDRQGWAVFISTPCGHNWFYDLFQVAGTREGWSRWHFPTSQNPIIPEGEIEEARKDVTEKEFSQEYLADFVSVVGSIFERQWFKIIDSAPVNGRLVRFWDLAATEARPGKDPAYTAGVLMSCDKDQRYCVHDVRRIRSNPGEVEKLIRHTAETDGFKVGIGIEQEPGSSGINTIDHYVRRVLNGFSVKGVRTTGSKQDRANPFAAQAYHNNVSLVRGDWNKAFLDELELFPAGRYKDQVDAASGAFSQIAGRRRLAISYLTSTGESENPFDRDFSGNPFDDA